MAIVIKYGREEKNARDWVQEEEDARESARSGFGEWGYWAKKLLLVIVVVMVVVVMAPTLLRWRFGPKVQACDDILAIVFFVGI